MESAAYEQFVVLGATCSFLDEKSSSHSLDHSTDNCFELGGGVSCKTVCYLAVDHASFHYGGCNDGQSSRESVVYLTLSSNHQNPPSSCCV